MVLWGSAVNILLGTGFVLPELMPQHLRLTLETLQSFCESMYVSEFFFPKSRLVITSR